jgi:UDP-glucose 4-epimerase
MLRHNVLKLIFSSTAAVYGAPSVIPIAEDVIPAPDNPYGESKLMFEKTLKWYGEACGLNSISIRYFNAAGATSLHGEHHVPETHLIPSVLNVALGKGSYVPILGTDYETTDGTCIRDYVHVADIADAHLKALSRVDGAGPRVYNLGSEEGYSVLEVLKTAEKITGTRIPVQFHPRRTGDPPALVASSKLIRKELGWTPRHTMEDTIESAWRWLNRFPEGYSSQRLRLIR